MAGGSTFATPQATSSACGASEVIEYQELVEESDFREEQRRLDEIQAAEQEFFDRIWYQRSLTHESKCEDSGDKEGLENLRRIAGPGRRRV